MMPPNTLKHRTQSKLESLQLVHRLFIDGQCITEFQRTHRRDPCNRHTRRIAQSGASRQVTGSIDCARIDKSTQPYGLFLARSGERCQQFGSAQYTARSAQYGIRRITRPKLVAIIAPYRAGATGIKILEERQFLASITARNTSLSMQQQRDIAAHRMEPLMLVIQLVVTHVEHR